MRSSGPKKSAKTLKMDKNKKEKPSKKCCLFEQQEMVLFDPFAESLVWASIDLTHLKMILKSNRQVAYCLNRIAKSNPLSKYLKIESPNRITWRKNRFCKSNQFEKQVLKQVFEVLEFEIDSIWMVILSDFVIKSIRF